MQVAPSERKLAAILIADAVGYSRRMGEDEEGALLALNSRRVLIEKAVANHRGRIFGGAGDSVVAEFPSAVDALKTAIEAQGAIGTLNEEKSETERMAFRVGINLGDVIVEGQNLFGGGVNIAERLQALAAPGGICISGSVHEQVRDKLRLKYSDLGERELKNIVHPVRAYLVDDQYSKPRGLRPAISKWRQPLLVLLVILLGIPVLLLSGYLQTWNQILVPKPSGPPTLAVLPFTNLSGDASQDYFGDGITQDIIAALSRFSNLSVLGSGATATFKGSTGNSVALQKLGARYVVTGSVRRSGDRVRVTADLTDTDGKQLHLWSRQFDREVRDIFAVQDEITRNIVGALAIKLSRIEQDRAFARETDQLDAYDYFLRGRTLLPTSRRTDNMEARAYFEKAIATDPHYAAAIAWLGQTYLTDAISGWTEFPADAVDRAEELSRQALSLSPELAEAYQLLATVDQARGKYSLAIADANRAIEINPSDAYGYATLGSALMWTGDANGAIAALEKARIFDPTLQWDMVFPLGFAYYFASRNEDAVNVLEPIAKVASDYGIYAFLAAAYAKLGRESDANRAAVEVRRLWPFFKVTQFVEQWKDEKSRSFIADGLMQAGFE